MQTGSGKTYTMGTGFKDGFQTGLTPQVMNALFSKIENLKHQTEFQLHVSFIEVHSNVSFLALAYLLQYIDIHAHWYSPVFVLYL